MLALTQEQRRFEWELARDQQTRAAAQLVSGRTHDLLNLVQIVQLAALRLANECSPDVMDSIDELAATATSARSSLRELLAVSRPIVPVTRGVPVGAAVEAALASVSDAIAVGLRLDLPPDTATRCNETELAHLVIGMVLDADHADPEILVRQRTIVGVPWVEIVRTTALLPTGDRFELRAVTAIIERAGGELVSSAARDGGFELVAALPVVVEREVVSSLS